jgi:hypothetical protein
VTETLALPLLVGSSTLVAVMVCVLATAEGVYSPVAEIVPVLASPPCTPSTLQVTAELEPLTTVDVNCCVWIVEIEAVAGAMVTPIWDASLTVTVALPLLVGSATLVAVTE